MNGVPCCIVDIDGTVADLTHRLHYIQYGNRDYEGFHEEVHLDAPINEIIMLVECLRDRFGKESIVFVSGRSELCREKTENWLEQYVGEYERLYMRKAGDYRKDTIIKEEILRQIEEDGYDPWLAIDDRIDIAKMWRENGIKTLHCSGWQNNSKPLRTPTLHVMVGPSGAGKTTLAYDMFPSRWIISSDDVRADMLGDSLDQSKNDQVFEAFHRLIKARLESGLDTVADATNLRKKDRKAVVELARGGPVVYHVINRPMDKKIETGGWRNDVTGLLQKHEDRFNSQFKDIMSGDRYENTTVEVY